VLNPYFTDEFRTGLAPELRTLMVDFPSVPVFAAVEVRRGVRDDILTLARWGITEFIAIGHDDTPVALRARFRMGVGRPLKVLLDGVLPAGLSGRAHAIVDAAAETVSTAGQAVDLAVALGTSRRTLQRWCIRARLPPPRRLLAWMRVLLAAELLDDPGRSVKSVAFTCGYSSDSGLRRVMHQFVRDSPSGMRRRGAFARAARVFASEVRQAGLADNHSA
jgi:AraC-like DNA-binding protein